MVAEMEFTRIVQSGMDDTNIEKVWEVTACNLLNTRNVPLVRERKNG